MKVSDQVCVKYVVCRDMWCCVLKLHTNMYISKLCKAEQNYMNVNTEGTQPLAVIYANTFQKLCTIRANLDTIECSLTVVSVTRKSFVIAITSITNKYSYTCTGSGHCLMLRAYSL